MSNCKKKATPAPAEEEAVKELDPEELCGVAGGVTDGSQQDTQPADILQGEAEEELTVACFAGCQLSVVLEVAI